MFAHNVFFTLKNATEAEKTRLVEACKHYLTGHPGTLFFACGTRAEALQRPVNDLAFHVSLHIIFDSQASHDTYQDAPRHRQFVDECRANWETVRVFDSEVTNMP